MTSEKFIRNKTALITLIAACLVVLISLGVRQTFGLFFMDFKDDLGISLTQSGLSIGLQMLMWGLTGPIFGAIADKYGGHKAISLAFIFFIAGIYFLYAGPNTGIFFQIDLGILVGIGLGGTAISIPMSIVGKHFPLSNRTIAMSLVTAVGSFGYFLSPLLTNFSLDQNGWENTLLWFLVFLIIGLIIAWFVRSPSLEQSIEKPSDQTTLEALNEAFGQPSILAAGFNYTAKEVLAKVRQRAGYTVDPYLDVAATDQSTFRDLVKNERRIELCFAGERFHDLRRLKDIETTEDVKGVKITKNSDDTFSFQNIDVERRNYESKNYYLPLPYAELILNSNLKQNQGWE